MIGLGIIGSNNLVNVSEPSFGISQTSAISWSNIAIIFGVIFVGLVVIVVAIIWLKRVLTRPEMMGMTREEIVKRWAEIRKTAATQGNMGAKLALLEADTLLDLGLKSIMMPGETLGERLKVACYKYPKLREVWWAHKLRNQLAHDATFNVRQREITHALNDFERALKILNVL